LAGQPLFSFHRTEDTHVRAHDDWLKQSDSILRRNNIWLQTPALLKPGFQVLNPHAGIPRPVQTKVPQYETQPVEELEGAIDKMFKSLNHDDLPEMEPDKAIKEDLLPHQKQALYFMTEKEKPINFGNKGEEKNTLWRVSQKPNGQKVYHNIISGDDTQMEPPQVFGGILADMMGLGKTLSILSLVVSSLPQAATWAELPSQALVWAMVVAAVRQLYLFLLLALL